MRDWLQSLLDSAIESVGKRITEIVKRFTALWATLSGLFTRTRASLNRARDTLRGVVAARLRHGIALLTTLRWIILVAIPRRVGDAVRSLITWTSRLIDDARNYARGVVDDLRRYALDRLSALRDTLRALASWASARIDEAMAGVRRLLSHVFGPLASPKRLAEWAIEEIALALGRWAERNAERLAVMLWRALLPAVGVGLSIMERVIARII